MSIILRLHASCLMLAAAGWLGLTAVRAADAPVAAARSGAAATAARPVLVVPVRGPIDKSLVFSLRRAFRQAHDLAPSAVVLELDTPGGGLAETEEIVAWLRAAQWPVYAYVNTHAQSAGAILCLACSRIYMAPGSRIGSALPIIVDPLGGGVQALSGDLKEKILSDTRALVRGLAQEKGYPAEVAMAMVDPGLGLKVGNRVICAPGQLLNLTAAEAAEVIPPRTQPLLARQVAPDLAALLADAGLAGAPVVRYEVSSAEILARWITLFGPLLLALGLFGLYLEFKIPGVLLPGIVGGALLAVYFFGHYVAGLAGWEDIALVVLGLVLLGVEVFVLPGFGVIGLAGLACLVAGIVMGLVPALPPPPSGLPALPVPELWPQLQGALIKLLGAMGLIITGAALAAYLSPRTRLYRDLVLDSSLTPGNGAVPQVAEDHAGLVGRAGVALTGLRPAGIAEVAGRRLDVVSSGDLIPRGAAVRVIAATGGRIVVEAVPAGPRA
jgi:membrane-bound serine protease (ClpP class)